MNNYNGLYRPVWWDVARERELDEAKIASPILSGATPDNDIELPDPFDEVKGG